MAGVVPAETLCSSYHKKRPKVYKYILNINSPSLLQILNDDLVGADQGYQGDYKEHHCTLFD